MKIKIIRKYQLLILISLFLIFLIGYKLKFSSHIVYEIGQTLSQDRIDFLNLFKPNPSRVISEVLEWNKTSQIEWMNLLKPPQDDPTLVEIIRTKFLWAPSTRYPFPAKLGEEKPFPGWQKQFDFLVSIIPHVNNRTNKYFEAGAHDGLSWSTTLSFERIFGWTGLLVEPTPSLFNSLWLLHRNAYLTNLCVSPKPYPLQTHFFINEDKSVSNGIAHLNNPEEMLDGVKYIPIQCVPVYTVLLALNYTEIDFFSLDIESVEYEVLKTIPFDQIKIHILFIEIQPHLNPSGGFDEISIILQRHGYIFVKQFGVDYIFQLKTN